VTPALRSLRRSPDFSLAAIATLTIGMAGAVAAFGILDSVLLEPLPFENPEEIVAIAYGLEGVGGIVEPLTAGEFESIRELSRTLAATTSIRVYGNGLLLSEEGPPDRMPVHLVDPDYFAVLGVPPLLGRIPDRSELRDSGSLLPDGTRPIVIDYGTWQQRWGGRVETIGRTIGEAGVTQALTIVAVMPPGFGALTPLLPEASAWIVAEPRAAGAFGGGVVREIIAVGRVAPGQTVRSARDEIGAILASAGNRPPETTVGEVRQEMQPRVMLLFDGIVGRDARRTTLLLVSAIWLVFAVGVMNVMSLQATRISRKQRELSIRASLGASRWALLRQPAVEALILAGTAAAVALVLVRGLQGLALATIPPVLPRWEGIAIDGKVFVFAAAVALVSALAIGVLPALRAARVEVAAVLSEGVHGVAGGRDQRRLGRGLILLETAVAVLLLVGAGLLIHNYRSMTAIDYGFDPDGVVAVEVEFPLRYDLALRNAFTSRLLEAMRGIPGVQAAAATRWLPGNRSARSVRNPAEVEASAPDGGGETTVPPPRVDVTVDQVTVQYLEAMGTSLLAGRWFDERDFLSSGDGGVTNVGGDTGVVVNESTARRFWPGLNPIGQIFPVNPNPNTWREVIGVVADTRDSYRAGFGPGIYLPYEQIGGVPPGGSVALVARAPGVAYRVIADLIRGLEPDSRVTIRSMHAVLGADVQSERFQTTFLSSFAAVAVLLAMLGVSGVVAFATAERTREIGIRMALGAERRNVVALMMRNGLVPAGLGIALGLAGGFALRRVLGSYLTAIEATHPTTYAIVFFAGLGLVLLAAWLPARRAATIDPVSALRQE